LVATVAALFGALPLVLARGTGSELRFPLGVTIMGGLLLSQLLTLYTTPVIYLYMERLRAQLWRTFAPPLAPVIGRAARPAGALAPPRPPPVPFSPCRGEGKSAVGGGGGNARASSVRFIL